MGGEREKGDRQGEAEQVRVIISQKDACEDLKFPAIKEIILK